MIGTVESVINAGSFYLVVVVCEAEATVEEVPVDARCMADLIHGSALLEPADLTGRRVEVGEGGSTLRVMEPWEGEKP